MKAWIALSLAFLLAAVGMGATGASVGEKTVAGKTVPANPTPEKPATAKAPPNTVVVHRCVDSKERVTLQGDPCPAGTHDTTREMTRPKDPPPRTTPLPAPAPPIIFQQPEQVVQRREIIPPPPIYKCTNMSGESRFSEQYDPNPRCEPIVLYYPYAGVSTPVGAQAITCRWIEDSCVRLTDWQACERFRAMRKEAQSAILHAFSDTAAYRKSELDRLNQIVYENCQ